MIALDGPGAPKVIEQVQTEYGARTGALDPADGALYLPTARFAPASDRGSRPAAVAGTAHLLVVKPR
ncbi:hypothetical protein [Sphingomonas sp. ID1715]|uniref:hypothetical protein n=1 Tax=Sphingomonas sp. ID1715 TaxID=1656898 RepID=UPI0020C26D35|nr:hypothetical protein [Sphingomonas sp. ID1715]